MKILFKKRILLIPIVSIAAALIVTGVVIGATAFSIPGKVDVTQATFDIEIYSDPAYSEPIKEINWNTVTQGRDLFKTVYVKNVSNSDVEVTATIQPPIDGITFATGSDKISVPIGKSVSWQITLKVARTVIPQQYLFAVHFESAWPAE
jgi:hypothetical protein